MLFNGSTAVSLRRCTNNANAPVTATSGAASTSTFVRSHVQASNTW
jgi:hypothetical protein